MRADTRNPTATDSGTAEAPRVSGASPPRAEADGLPAGLEGRLLARLLRSLGGPPLRARLPNGREVGDPGASFAVHFRDRGALYRLLIDPDFYFGEGYSEGRIEIEGDLSAFLEAVYRAGRPRRRWRDRLPTSLRGLVGRRGLAAARSNIHHHYDLGNDFYRLWLDERMVYTCAYFSTPAATLEAAQVAKLDHVCRKLRLRAGETVAEAGCGWGALALHMAGRYGVRVRAFNISREQIAYARARAAAEGLADRVEFVEDDYRNLASSGADRGRYDAFVSVGMLEHVGVEHYAALGRVIDRCLTGAGRGLLHTIGRHKPTSLSTWIAARVFPAGYPPALSEMLPILEPRDFAVLDVENLRLHYARTLAHWLARFEAAADRVRARFDERFVRMWRLYLAGSMVAFTTGYMQLFQVLFSRYDDAGVPWTREHLYGAFAEVPAPSEPGVVA